MLLDTLAPVLLPLLQRWLVMLLEGGLEYLIRQIQSQADPQMEQPMPTPMQARRIQ
jgi:hypothetical protein